ncbi:MAG TPA: GTP-binding protein [Planctomycetota bacterium]|nr:GTP-binding protein [Planctomycetota bacterium]
MATDRLRIAFLGHVDHGKSTLIGRLLCDTGSFPPDRMEQLRLASVAQGSEMEFAYLVDQLREEREQAMTIDTARLFFRTVEREYLVIDAPGHREFLKNMLTGASQADAAVLIVDASQGIGEQTRRHAFLLSLLGIRCCVVAVNKMDLVGYSEARFLDVRGAVHDLTGRLGLACTACVPISAKLGDNVVVGSEHMPWYDGPAILDAIAAVPAARDTDLPLRFCVQDVYHFNGRRIVAGRVLSGSLAPGARIVVLPDEQATQVVSVERFQSARTVAEAGECVGLTLPDEVSVRRGQVLCDPGDLPRVTSGLRVELFWMSPNPLSKRERLPLRLSTQEAECQIARIRRRVDSASLDVLEEDAALLGDAEVGELDLALATPVVVEPFSRIPPLGRVVLERDGNIVGAGVVTDITPHEGQGAQ